MTRSDGHRQLPSVLKAACDAASGVSRIDDAVRYGLEAIALNDDDRDEFDVGVYLVTNK